LRILIDIGHPAHVHLFKRFAWQMQKKDHVILFSVREKGESIMLLKKANLNFVVYAKTKKGVLPKIYGVFEFNYRLHKIVTSFKPNISLSHSSFYLSQISKWHGVPNITLEDTGNAEQVILYKFFTTHILTANVFHKEYGTKQIKYNSYHELAYLHPNRFKANPSIRKELGLIEKENAILFRFVSWEASHDIGQSGFSKKDKISIVENLSQNHRVFISTESSLPKEFEKYKLQTLPHQIHDVIAQMNLFIGEGATMASECAVLGIPAIYVNTMDAGTIDDQEKYGLLYHFKSSKGVLDKALEILTMPNREEVFEERRQKMLYEKIDLTAFLVWFIENYPESAKIMKENPDYQYNFK